MFSFLKKIFGKEELDYTALLKRQVHIIDVRTSQEFNQGHADLSTNIPLRELPDFIYELKKENRPIVTCCRSGMRSAKAAATLREAGLEAYNGGSWNKVQKALN